MIDLDFEGLDPEELARLDAEWLAVSALRDTLDIANKGNSTPTYQAALDFGERLAPELFSRQRSVFRRIQADAELREYHQRADAESSLTKKQVSPLEIVDREIADCRRLLATPGPRDQLLRRLRKLESVRERLLPQLRTEHTLLFHDVFLARRPRLPELPGGDNCRDFRLPDAKLLRLRLLHPDRPEHTTGADVLYEVCATREARARVAFVQYKIWDGKVLYSSRSRNLERQVSKLSQLTCAGDLCSSDGAAGPPDRYRLPCCGAFLRPTDRLQAKGLRLVSRGFHVPICVARELLRADTAIHRHDLQGRALGARMFEELFAQGFAGSRWLPYERVEDLYRLHHILDPSERIVVHAQEFEDEER
jgi:hypothetical protein